MSGGLWVAALMAIAAWPAMLALASVKPVLLPIATMMRPDVLAVGRVLRRL